MGADRRERWGGCIGEGWEIEEGKKMLAEVGAGGGKMGDDQGGGRADTFERGEKRGGMRGTRSSGISGWRRRGSVRSGITAVWILKTKGGGRSGSSRGRRRRQGRGRRQRGGRRRSG